MLLLPCSIWDSADQYFAEHCIIIQAYIICILEEGIENWSTQKLLVLYAALHKTAWYSLHSSKPAACLHELLCKFFHFMVVFASAVHTEVF